MRLLPWTLTFAAPLFAQRSASNPSSRIASTSEFVFAGPNVPQQTVALTSAAGDWFALPGDAHAWLELRNGPNGRVVFALQWDGKQKTHVITPETNSGSGGHTSSFAGSLTGESFTLAGEDSVVITVDQITDQDVDATVTGTAQLGGDLTNHFAVRGRIRLHRDATPARVRTATYGQCDNVVHDRFTGAQNRSASECETKFNADVMAALDKAFARVVPALEAKGWTVETRPDTQPLESVARHVEDRPFLLGGTTQSFHFVLRREDPGAVAALHKAIESLDQRKIEAAGHAFELATTIDIDVGINGDGADSTVILVGSPRLKAATSTMTLQNVRIRIKASPALTAEITRLIDYDALKAMLAK